MTLLETNGTRSLGDSTANTVRALRSASSIRTPMVFVAVTGALLLPVSGRLSGQTDWKAGKQWTIRRLVLVQPAPSQDGDVCKLEFLAHGHINAQQPDLVVLSEGEPVPFRVVQRGPGDFVRLVFQPKKGQARYEVYYGGAVTTKPSKWAPSKGLLFEVRQFQRCDLTRFGSVQKAFDASETIGADFVPAVYLGNLLFAGNTQPVLCRFSGPIQIQNAGKYKFCTSSRDASWLLINGKPVVAWPGRHGAVRQARHIGEVSLSHGRHQFEYYNATSGNGFQVVAAWQPPGAAKIAPIPPAAFGTVRYAKTSRVETRAGIILPDVTFELFAEAPLGAGRPPLIKVRFRTGFNSGTLKWDFGDGQSATAVYPEHIYLRPGPYTVRCVRSSSSVVVNRVDIQPPWHRFGAKDAQADISAWLTDLKPYDATTLPAADLQQLVRVYLELEDVKTAVEIGVNGLVSRKPDSLPRDPDAAARLAVELASVLDERLNQSEKALELCDAVLAMKPTGASAAGLWLISADLALKLKRDSGAKKRFDTAARLVKSDSSVQLQLHLAMLQGDYARRIGRVHDAETSYAIAQEHSVSQQWDARRRAAMAGAYSRGVEDALRSGVLEQAGTTLHQWATEMPLSQLDGYYALLRSQYELARKRYSQAILVAEDALRIIPDSPYSDRLLITTAQAQVFLGDAAGWKTSLERLIKEYPGSPGITDARRQLGKGFPTPATNKDAEEHKKPRSRAAKTKRSKRTKK